MSSYDDSFRILVLRDPEVDKSGMFPEYFTGIFQPNLQITIGVDLISKTLTIDKKKYKLTFWDLAVGERFRFLLPNYCLGANAAVLLYDVTSSQTLDNIGEWANIVRQKSGDVPILLVGIMSNEKNKRQVSVKEGKEIAKSKNLNGFIEIHARTGENVGRACETITRLILGNKGYHSPQKQDEDLPLYCYKCNLQLTKEEFLNHPCFITGAVSLRGAKMGKLKHLLSKLAKLVRRIAQNSKKENIEERPLLNDEDIMILDLESKKGKKLMKQYKKQIGKSATQRGKETERFVKWLKGEKVETRELKDLIEGERMSSEKNEIFKGIESALRIKDYVERALEILTKLMLLYSKYYDKELDSFLEKIKKWKDYDEDKYPYSEILKLYSGDNEYRRNFLQEVRRREGNYKDRYPYPYVFKPPEPPDDLATAPRVQLHASPKKEDPKNEIYCQYCGKKLTKEEQFTHSCKKKPE